MQFIEQGCSFWNDMREKVETILISVILVSYNEDQFLSEAIESCLSQNVAEMEIIICDDGSDDGSLNILKNYAEKYPDKIRYFVADRNDIRDKKSVIPSIRVSNNIKKGLKMARGRYILCMSGDDYLCDSHKLSEAIIYLEEHSCCSAYVSGYKKVWGDGREQIFVSSYPRLLFWSRHYLHLSSFVFRRSVFEQGFFLERFCDDTGLIYSLACAGKWKYSDKITFAYRQRDKSIMHEADKLELNILELMLFQDIANRRRFYYSSLSRFYAPLKYVFIQRRQLYKYKKYLNNSREYDCDILEKLASYDTQNLSCKIRILGLICVARICRDFFWLLQKLFRCYKAV